MLSVADWDGSYKNNQTPWREPVDINELVTKSSIDHGYALDLGCGTGEWAIALSEKGFEVEALDYSQEAINIAKEQPNKVAWSIWDLEDLASFQLKRSSYDIIVDHKVLAFIANKAKYLEYVASILGGVYVLTVFHEQDKKPSICVPKEEFDRLILPRFEIIHSDVLNPRPGKVYATYYLRKK